MRPDKHTDTSHFKNICEECGQFHSDVCAYCGGPDAWNVDAHHRFTPLCDDCYGDPNRREVTRFGGPKEKAA
jgi:hypothetical protein